MNSECETQSDRARRLRPESTGEERKLWMYLRAKRMAGFKFRRKHPIGPYLVDFCCSGQRLVIELDSQHADLQEEQQDALKMAYLNRQGYRVMHLCKNQVNTEIKGVLQAIHAMLGNWRIGA
jgi:very-short-patch-repair endonuclease